jgi:hypothetical protein
MKYEYVIFKNGFLDFYRYRTVDLGFFLDFFLFKVGNNIKILPHYRNKSIEISIGFLQSKLPYGAPWSFNVAPYEFFVEFYIEFHTTSMELLTALEYSYGAP